MYPGNMYSGESYVLDIQMPISPLRVSFTPWLQHNRPEPGIRDKNESTMTLYKPTVSKMFLVSHHRPHHPYSTNRATSDPHLVNINQTHLPLPL